VRALTHSRSARTWLGVYAAGVLAFLMLPSLIVIVISFSADPGMRFPPHVLTLSWYRQFLSSPEWLAALAMSLEVACLASAIATVTGTLASFGLRRLEGRVATALRAVLLAPAIVPVVLIAAATFMLFARLHLENRFLGIVVAHAGLGLPLVLITMSAALESYDFALDRAARSLGAPALVSFFTVTLPQIKGALVASALFAFLTSFDEAVIALFITAGSRATLAQRMFESLRDDLDPVIAAIATLLITLTGALLLLGGVLRRERP